MTAAYLRSLVPVRRRALLLATTALCATLSYFVAFLLHTEFALPNAQLRVLLETLPILLLVRIGFAWYYRIEEDFWQHVSLHDLVRLCGVVTLGSAVFPALLILVGKAGLIPLTIFLLEWMLNVAITGGARVVARLTRERDYVHPAPGSRRTFIIGAGEAGEQILRQLQHDKVRRHHVVGLIDDDPAKQGRVLHGVPVVGNADQLRGLVSLHNVSHVLIAIASATPEELRRLVDRCADARVEMQMLPPLKDQVTSEVSVNQVREVQIEDLLGRAPISLDLEAIKPDIAGKVIAVTGAGGSIGSELARQIARLHPKELILVERAESPLHYIHLEVSRANREISVIPLLASVTNSERLQSVFDARKPDCVFHAAAYKHVPMLEWNVVEGVWNNIIGTLRAAKAAARSGCKKFVLISTDKAVKPTSVLGATKLIAERVVLDLPSLRSSATDFRVVRFGNVLGSEGSVIPMFKQQMSMGGPLTVTHPEMKRYFMTIPEAVQLVLQAVALPEAAGRISLLEMGRQVKIVDMAENLIRLAGLVPHKDIEIVFTGLRPGEKLEEELLGPGEVAMSTSVEKIRVVQRNVDAASAAQLARHLRRLTEVASWLDEADIRRALAAVAPEYTTNVPVTAPARTTRRPVRVAAKRRSNMYVVNGTSANGNGNGASHSNGNGASHHNGNGTSHTNGNGNGNGNRVALNGNGRHRVEHAVMRDGDLVVTRKSASGGRSR